MTAEQRLLILGGLLSAIGVVANALWYHHRDGMLEHRGAETPKTPKTQAIRAASEDLREHLIVSRWAGMLFAVVQVMLLVSNRVLREDLLGAGVLLLGLALVLQGWAQTAHERRLVARFQPHTSQLPGSRRTAGPSPWTALAYGTGFLVANGIGFFLCTQVVLLSVYGLAQALGVRGPIWLGLLALGLAGGVGLGLWALYRTLPHQMRWLLQASHPTRKAPPPLADGLAVPSEHDRLNAALALLSNEKQDFAKRTEILVCDYARVFNSPGALAWGTPHRMIYLDRTLLMTWPPETLAAVLAHELAHLEAEHGRERFWTLLSTACGAFFVTGGLVALTAPLGGMAVHGSTLLGALIVLILPTVRLKKIVTAQELEADHVAVHTFGAAPQALLQALERLEEQQSFGSYSGKVKRLPGTSANPLTALRMRALKEQIAHRAQSARDAAQNMEKNKTPRPDPSRAA